MELTVNDIIRKVRERKERLETEPERTYSTDLIVAELECLLDYIEKDEEY